MADRDGAKIAQLALSWVGTPYQHQASLRGVGADCIGVLRGIWRARFGEEPWHLPAYSPDWAATGSAAALWSALSAWLEPVEGAPQPGDVLGFAMRRKGPVCHVGVHAGDVFVHAYSGRGVVATGFSAAWNARCRAVFRFPGRND